MVAFTSIICSTCKHPIGPRDVVLQAENAYFHPDCFKCTRCHRRIDDKCDGYTRASPGRRLLCLPCSEKPETSAVCSQCRAPMLESNGIRCNPPVCLTCSRRQQPQYKPSKLQNFEEEDNNYRVGGYPSVSSPSSPMSPGSPKMTVAHLPVVGSQNSIPLLPEATDPETQQAVYALQSCVDSFRLIESRMSGTIDKTNAGYLNPGEAKTKLALIEAELNKLQTARIDSIDFSDLDDSAQKACRSVRKDLTSKINGLLDHLEKLFPLFVSL